MIESNRRNFIALAGASALLTSCGEDKSKPAEIVGFDDHYGDDPASAPRPGWNFVPRDVTLILIRLNADGTLESVHGSYLQPAKNYEAIIVGWLANIDPTKPLALPAGYYPKSTGKDLANIGFGSQRRIFIYVVNPTLSFTSKRLVSFTKYGADGQRKSRNKTFYNARLANSQSVANRLLYMENHYKNDRYYDHGNAASYYSMNLHLEIKTPNGTSIPIIIDPGTGNGNNWDY